MSYFYGLFFNGTGLNWKINRIYLNAFSSIGDGKSLRMGDVKYITFQSFNCQAKQQCKYHSYTSKYIFATNILDT